MVTAVSTAHLAVILTDARKGMGLDWSMGVFRRVIATECLASARMLGLRDVRFVAISAIDGDMLSDAMSVSSGIVCPRCSRFWNPCRRYTPRRARSSGVQGSGSAARMHLTFVCLLAAWSRARLSGKRFSRAGREG